MAPKKYPDKPTSGSAAVKKLHQVQRQSLHKKRPEIFTTTHKARAEWFRERAAWPAREAPVRTLIRERRRVASALQDEPGDAQWESAGPTNIGGRMTAIVCDPADPDRIVAGAAGGGLWASDNAGLTWRSLWHKQDSLNVGSLAIDPQNPQTLYCGTGEANLSADSYPGVGVLRSLDGGESWHRLATPLCDGVPIRIGVIAVDPFDSDHLLLGGIGHHFSKEEQPGGLYVSRDGGQTWLRESFVAEQNYWCHAAVFHPTDRDVLFATFTEEGSRNGIWRSVDCGATWEHLSSGLPSPELFGRASVAIAPSNPAVVYAITSDTQSGVLGVFRSSDGGDTWAAVHGGHFDEERQMSYNNTIAVHPEDEDHLLCGGVDLHLSRDGGGTWTQVTHWQRERGESDYAHADHHALLMPPGTPGRVYDMNDGGVDVSDDGGSTWANRSQGLAITMYYDLDVAQTNGDFYGGGAQDNGTPITTSGGVDDHFDLTGGDGGYLVFDPSNELHIYASVYNMLIQRFRSTDGWQSVTPPEDAAVRRKLWMVPITMDPADSDVVFTGSHRVWRTRDDAASWQAVSGSLDGSTIRAIEVCIANPGRIYVGTAFGGFFRSEDGGDTWSGNLAGASLPGRTITRIKASPDDEDRLLLTVANFGHSHVYRSTDGGASWEDADGGALPDVPHSSLAIPRVRPDEVYVANDVGVFVSHDFGDTWRNLTRNLPSVNVVDLVYRDADGTLSAATYGRGIWRIGLE